MRAGVPMKVCDTFTSTFTETGGNLGLSPTAVRERNESDRMIPPWVQALKAVWITHHRLRRVVAGHFSLKATSYATYTLKSPEQRVTFDVPKPTGFWWQRM